MDDTVYAKVFGVDFPVCSVEQKAELEEAFEFYKTHPDSGEHKDECFCTLIAKLLTGKADMQEQMAAANTVAKYVYTQKAMILALSSLAQEALLQPTDGETVH